MNTTTEKKKFVTRDVMVIAAMMVLTFAVYGAVGTLTLPFPFFYLYLAAGIQEFFCATFYLVVANRLNKHGILLICPDKCVTKQFKKLTHSNIIRFFIKM